MTSVAPTPTTVHLSYFFWSSNRTRCFTLSPLDSVPHISHIYIWNERRVGTLSFALISFASICHLLLLLLPCDYLKIVQGWRASSESKIKWIYSLPLSVSSSSPFNAYSSSFFYLHSVIPLPIIFLTVTSRLNLIHPFFPFGVLLL